MAKSISDPSATPALADPLAWVSLALALAAAAIVIWYLLRSPPLDRRTKLALLAGIGALPIGAALAGNAAGLAVTTERSFCASCHVMTPYTEDSDDPTSGTLASLHGQNRGFGRRNCYTCHADYSMFGLAITKASGLLHVWHYYGRYRSRPLEEVIGTLKLYRPFTNDACLECHSTEIPTWLAVTDHRGALDDLERGAVGCASAGCHGPAHPFSKRPAGRAREEDRP